MEPTLDRVDVPDAPTNDFPSGNASHEYFCETACVGESGDVVQPDSNSWIALNQHLFVAHRNVDTVQTVRSTGSSTSTQHLVEPDGCGNGNGPHFLWGTGSTSNNQYFEADGHGHAIKYLCSPGSTSNQHVFETDGDVDALQRLRSLGGASKKHFLEVDGNVNSVQPFPEPGSSSKQQIFDGLVEIRQPFGSSDSTSRQHPFEFDTVNALEYLCINDTANSDKSNVKSLELQQGMETDQLSDSLITAAKGHRQTNKYLMKEGQILLSEASFCIGMETCAICHNEIQVEDTAQIKGCEHSYCVTCILRWATYKSDPWCPQCRHPFSFLFVYRALDGTLSDYLVEESVCLLLRAFWFKSTCLQSPEEQVDCEGDFDAYEEPHYIPNIRLGNRRWGDSGYVRAGRHEARPVSVRKHLEPYCSGGSSQQSKDKGSTKEILGRRARQTKRREQHENR